MDYYGKTVNFDDDATDTEDDSGIAEAPDHEPSMNYFTNQLNFDMISGQTDALAKFFAYW